MLLGTPVVAVNSGGPLETVLHEVSGFLCEQSAAAFAQAMLRLIGPVSAEQMAKLLASGSTGSDAASNVAIEGGGSSNNNSSASSNRRTTPVRKAKSKALVAAAPPDGDNSSVLLYQAMAPYARAHVVHKFTSQVMKATLESYVQQTAGRWSRHPRFQG
jgi:glycosyltransferase involved in cell wall biosynthesis